MLNVDIGIKLKLIHSISKCRQLAKISRSTRGIVLLLCDLNAARRVMSEAQRLKMTGGHFIWIWADTSSTAEFFQPYSVPNIDDKDQIINAKANYDSRTEEFGDRKTKYDILETPTERQYYQHGNKPPQQNSTRYKSTNMNSNRFHHIIGLRKPSDDMPDDSDLPSILPERSFLKNDKFGSDMSSTGQAPMKDKRASVQFSKKSEKDFKDVKFDTNPIENDYTSSLEIGKKSNHVNIKNINSQEFNANYYDPYSPSRSEGESDNSENLFDEDSAESTNEENSYYDYDKGHAYKPSTDATSASFTSTTKRSMSDMDTKGNEKSRVNNHKASMNSNRNNLDNGNINNAPLSMDQITTIAYSKFLDDNEGLGLESYSESSNDLKAKRADNFPSSYNISSHVFFHHFKDFPVGLLALRHVKMNIDRVFVRSAIRLFATTWSRVEKDEEQRQASGGKVGGRKNNWQDNWSANDNDYDEPNNNFKNKKQKNKTNVNVNSRHNNARGSKKYKRDAKGAVSLAEAIQTSISHLVNSSNKISNPSSKLNNILTNKNYSQQHVSDLNSQPRDDVNKSNNDNTKKHNVTNNSNITNLNESATLNKELVSELRVAGEIDIQKRQNTWWADTLRGRNQEKVKTSRGIPQYKGGCFGVASRSDLKRSELFSRFVLKLINTRRL